MRILPGFWWNILCLTVIAVFMASCGPTAEIIAEDEPEIEEEVEELPAASAMLSSEDLTRFRSSLSDQFTIAQNAIVDIFELTDEDRRAVAGNSGFRIQILSTDSVSEADSLSLAYYDWAMEQDLPYERTPEAYILFRQPNYRVRVGDFTSRSRAIEFLNIIRPHFPGAWVVIDTIDRDLVE